MIKTIMKSVLGRQQPAPRTSSVVGNFTRGNLVARIIEKRDITNDPEYLIDLNLFVGYEPLPLGVVRVKDLSAQLDLLQQAADHLSKRMHVR